MFDGEYHPNFTESQIINIVIPEALRKVLPVSPGDIA